MAGKDRLRPWLGDIPKWPPNRPFRRQNPPTFLARHEDCPKMLRAGLYARVSTNDQQTLAMQNRAMREYAARRGWTIRFRRQRQLKSAYRARSATAHLLSPRDRNHTKAEAAGAGVRCKHVADGRAQIASVAAIRTAADHPLVAATQPRAPVIRRSGVTIVIPILDPFVNVAMHVVQPPGVRLKTSYWRGPVSVNALARATVRMAAIKVRLV